jgi:hypothetical protein
MVKFADCCLKTYPAKFEHQKGKETVGGVSHKPTLSWFVVEVQSIKSMRCIHSFFAKKRASQCEFSAFEIHIATIQILYFPFFPHPFIKVHGHYVLAWTSGP